MALRGRGFVSVGAVVACCALAAACTPEPGARQHAVTDAGRDDARRVSDRAPDETRL